jgi:mannosyltransferase OCH1-like enzyme
MRSLTILLNEPDQKEQILGNTLIPKKIHISWKNRDILTSEHIFAKRCVQSLIELSKDWEVDLSLNEDIDLYLKRFLDYYDYSLIKDRHIVEKSDLWRLIKMYYEGGLYVDIDRLCNTSIDDIIKNDTMCLLPTCEENNFSQDFMCSAPNNPIFSNTIELILARRREGHSNVYFLGPQTYMHGVTKTLLGEIVDVNPGSEIFEEMRSAISQMQFIVTYRESTPYNTIIYRPEKSQIDFDHEEMKRDFYAKSNIKHWTGEW